MSTLEDHSDITQSAVKRILRRAGVKRINVAAYAAVVQVLAKRTRDIVKNALVFMEHCRRKTLQRDDVLRSLNSLGTPLAAGFVGASFDTFTESAGSRKTTTGGHRWKPGTVALRDIKLQQRNSDSLAIPHQPFERFTRAIIAEFNDNARVEGGAIELIQLASEKYATQIARYGNEIAVGPSSRETLMAGDIELAARILERS